MEYYKNTDHMNSEYFRKDNIKSKFRKPDDGTRWWVVHTDIIFGVEIKLVSESFHSEEDARKFMEGYSKDRKVYLIKGKYIEIIERD